MKSMADMLATKKAPPLRILSFNFRLLTYFVFTIFALTFIGVLIFLVGGIGVRIAYFSLEAIKQGSNITTALTQISWSWVLETLFWLFLVFFGLVNVGFLFNSVLLIKNKRDPFRCVDSKNNKIISTFFVKPLQKPNRENFSKVIGFIPVAVLPVAFLTIVIFYITHVLNQDLFVYLRPLRLVTITFAINLALYFLAFWRFLTIKK